MQKSGTEWLFRLAQEPRRLARRYVKDLWVFGSAFAGQYWRLRKRLRRNWVNPSPLPAASGTSSPLYQFLKLPSWFDIAAIRANALPLDVLLTDGRPCVLDLSEVRFIDSTGVGALVRLQKNLRSLSSELFLVCATPQAARVISMLRLDSFFNVLPDEAAASAILAARTKANASAATGTAGRLIWSGEVTSANAEAVWELTKACLGTMSGGETVLDLSQVPFIDSTGLGLLVRAKKYGEANGIALRFIGLQPAVQNVVRLARLNTFLSTENRAPARSSGSRSSELVVAP